MRFIPGAAPMKAEILRFVALDTAVNNAMQIMTQNGFSCERKTNADFMASDHGKTSGAYLKNKNYLYCDYTQPGFILSADRRWQVALIVKDEKISEIYVSYGLIAL